MDIRTTSRELASADADWLILGLFDEEQEVAPAIRSTSLEALIARLTAEKFISRAIGDISPILGVEGFKAKAILAVGLGTRAKLDAGGAFSAGVSCSKRIASKPRERVTLALPDLGDSKRLLGAFLQGMVVGARGPDLCKSERGRHPYGSLTIFAPDGQSNWIEETAREALIVGEAINFARDCVNTPPREKNPTALAERFRASSIEAGIGVEVWDEARCRTERFGGLLGVSAGSDEPPAFVVLDYRKGGDARRLALVGKGVTFDSGGLSLKPSSSMEDMKSDMTGAAVVAAVMQAVARLGLPVNLTGYLALTENMTGGRATKLGDVLTIRNGKTVEVLNTDAEGRLILADALSYAAESKPQAMLDLATLTGACLVALGTKIAGLFSNQDGFANEVLAASSASGERAWRMPLDDDFKEALKSHVADFKNVGGKWGGAITAAKFLEQFVDGIPWVHLDIAGPSWADNDSASRDAGGTGCFVRTLVELVRASVPS